MLNHLEFLTLGKKLHSQLFLNHCNLKKQTFVLKTYLIPSNSVDGHPFLLRYFMLISNKEMLLASCQLRPRLLCRGQREEGGSFLAFCFT